MIVSEAFEVADSYDSKSSVYKSSSNHHREFYHFIKHTKC